MAHKFFDLVLTWKKWEIIFFWPVAWDCKGTSEIIDFSSNVSWMASRTVYE